jgi:Ca2+ transporting ATPase
VFQEFVGGLYREEKDHDFVETIGNMANFIQVANNLKVLARSSEDEKYLLVAGLKQLGNVVAMTAKNGAEALRKADVGFSMGI